jgi:hypothetical protein
MSEINQRGLHHATNQHQTGDNATWDDLMYEIYVRQAIEAGVIESDAGRTVDGKEMRAKLGWVT